MARPKLVSDEQKELQDHSRFKKNVPSTKPIEKLWRAPKGLKSPGKKLYKTAGGILVEARAITDLDFEAFAQLCFTYDSIYELREILNRDGWVSPGRTAGTWVKNPASTQLKSVMQDYKWLLESFGLSPLFRGRLSLPVDANPADKVRERLFGGVKK